MAPQRMRAFKDTYAHLLKDCIRAKALAWGKHAHARITSIGLESDILLGNTLVEMYSECSRGGASGARRVFDKLPRRNVFSWTIIISAYAKHGHGEEALALFEQMQREGVKPNEATFVTTLMASASLGILEQGKQIHAAINKNGLEVGSFLGSTLVDMYSKCGHIENARKVFDNMHGRDLVTWSVMIAGYVKHGYEMKALTLFREMRSCGVKPDKVTFAGVLKACAGLASLEHGKHAHAGIEESGLDGDPFVENTLIDMYAKCGSLDDARRMFDNMHKWDVVSWSTIISAYAHRGHVEEAFALFEAMRKQGVEPNTVTFVGLLKACTNSLALEWGKQLHNSIEKTGLNSDSIVVSTLVDMYAKCGSLEDARRVFDGTCKRDVVVWSAMIAGYVQSAYSEEALTLYERMQEEGVRPNKVTFVNALKACSNLTLLEWGKRIHASAKENGFGTDVSVGKTLIHMYAKCGSIEDAQKVFSKMHPRDVVAWTTMITGYAQHGRGGEVLTLLEQMQREGVKPNKITFTSVLSACSRVGLVDEGEHIFNSMSRIHGITPTAEHYGCMIDLFGRLGLLIKADDFISKMPYEPDVSVWVALLGSCKTHNGSMDLGRRFFERIIGLQPKNTVAYMLLLDIYSAVGRWDEVTKLREDMKDAIGNKIGSMNYPSLQEKKEVNL